MTKSILLAPVLALLISFGGNAQDSFTEDLDLVSESATNCRAAAKVSGLALKSLAIDYFVQQNPSPDTESYVTIVDQQSAVIQQSAEDIIESAEDALTKNSNLDIDDVLVWAENIEQLNEEILDESQIFVNYVENDQQQAALASGQQIRAFILQLIGVCNSIIDEVKALKLTPMNFNVRMVLEDSYGNPIIGSTGLQGYYAYNEANDEYFYAGAYQTQDPDLFTDLPEGTYTFGAFDGYFDGAGSNTVTIADNLPLNENGEIEVILVYWSE